MEQSKYNRWLDAFAAKASRPWRLAAFTFLISLIYPGTRFFLLAVIFIVLVVKAVEYGVKNGRWWGLKILIGVFLFACLVYVAAAAEAYRVAKYRRSVGDTVPLNLKKGVYEGIADGARGPIHVSIKIQYPPPIVTGDLRGPVWGINAPMELQQETASIGGNALKDFNHRYYSLSIPWGYYGTIDNPRWHRKPLDASWLMKLNEELRKNNLDQAIDSIDSITGATLTSRGYKKAVKTAIIKAQKDARVISGFTAGVYFFLKNDISKISFNTLAIIFILVVFFDYTLQGLLIRGTGQAVSCMNCQTCVGACPVKRVEIDGKKFTFPMDMVLHTRLGDYEAVKKLARFCVGCARCSGKCPIGISAPSVASAAIQYLKAREAEEKAKAGARAVRGGRNA